MDFSASGIKKAYERNNYFQDMADDDILPLFPGGNCNPQFWKSNKQRDVLHFFLVDKKGKLHPPANMLSRSANMEFDDDDFCLVGDISSLVRHGSTVLKASKTVSGTRRCKPPRTFLLLFGKNHYGKRLCCGTKVQKLGAWRSVLGQGSQILVVICVTHATRVSW